MTRLLRWLMSLWVRKHYGKRCEFTHPMCANCKAWMMLDNLFDDDWDAPYQPVRIALYVNPDKVKWDGGAPDEHGEWND